MKDYQRIDPDTSAAVFATGKDFLVLVPLVGTALAVTYDVGYFNGFGIRFFSFFSLSEHIVFALSAFPEALVFAFGIGVISHYRIPLTRGLKAHRASIWIMIGAVVLLNGLFLLFGAYVAVAGTFISAMFIAFSISIKDVVIRMVFVAAAALLLAYVVGYEASRSYLYPTFLENYLFNQPRSTIVETTTAGKIEAKLIRSGDRELLFFDVKAKQVILLRWDEIKAVSTAPE